MCFVYIYYVYINTHTHSIYFENIDTCIHLHSYIFNIEIKCILDAINRLKAIDFIIYFIIFIRHLIFYTIYICVIVMNRR